MSITIKNLEAAFAGESQAHIKYRYFAKLARAEGHEDVAKHFEHTADQELLHAWGHLELLVGKPSTKQCLKMAIAGETQEFTVMYPAMEADALLEGAQEAAREIREQIEESKEHADAFEMHLKEMDDKFKTTLSRAQKRFSALKKVERRHAAAYQQQLEKL
jgi:rubrerythrin